LKRIIRSFASLTVIFLLCKGPSVPSGGAEMIQVKIDLHDEKQVTNSLGTSTWN